MTLGQTKAQISNRIIHEQDEIAIHTRRLWDLAAEYLDQGGSPETLSALMGISKASLYRGFKTIGVLR